MKLFKNIISILFSVLLGIYFGTTLYNSYLYKDSNKINYYKIYVLEYGPFDNMDLMKDKSITLDNYFYYIDEKGYHVILGISENKEIINKVGELFKDLENINIREELINNMEFIENLRQYDNLIINSNSNEILESENQIIDKYEELIINEESIN